ncbi:MAG: hypothetical protein V3T83_10020 [Acidobacteriota bacterium]
MIRKRTPSMWRDFPTSVGSAPKRLRHSRRLMTTTRSEPGFRILFADSPAQRQRPIDQEIEEAAGHADRQVPGRSTVAGQGRR